MKLHLLIIPSLVSAVIHHPAMTFEARLNGTPIALTTSTTAGVSFIMVKPDSKESTPKFDMVSPRHKANNDEEKFLTVFKTFLIFMKNVPAFELQVSRDNQVLNIDPHLCHRPHLPQNRYLMVRAYCEEMMVCERVDLFVKIASDTNSRTRRGISPQSFNVNFSRAPVWQP